MIKSPFKPPLTFLNLPLSTEFSSGDIAVVGLPFDCGNSRTRFGCRLGPNAVRQASILTADLLTDAEPSPLDSRRIVDAGDIDLPLDDIHAAFDAIERGIREIVEAGATPLTLGGDGSVSLPVLRAMHQRYPDLAVLHLDAHTDAYPLAGNNHYDNATQFTHALNEGLVDVAHAIHIGTRGPVNAMKTILHVRDMGYEVISLRYDARMGRETPARTPPCTSRRPSALPLLRHGCLRSLRCTRCCDADTRRIAAG